MKSEVFSVAATLGDDVDGARSVVHGFPPVTLSAHSFSCVALRLQSCVLDRTIFTDAITTSAKILPRYSALAGFAPEAMLVDVTKASAAHMVAMAKLNNFISYPAYQSSWTMMPTRAQSAVV